MMHGITFSVNQQDETSERDTQGRWVAGTSGNPAGRPVGSGSIVTELRRLIDETDSSGETVAAVIARQLVDLAKSGDLRAIKECFDRLDGSPRQTAVTISEPFTFGKIVL